MMSILKKLLLAIVILVTICIVLVIYSAYIKQTHTNHESSPKEVKYVTIDNGDEIAYQEIDNSAKVTVIFVGGLSGWSGTWKRTIEELQKKHLDFNYIMLDLPPFGYSKVKDENINGRFFRGVAAKRVNLFRESKNLNEVIFVGHSYGAGIVTEAVMEKPDGVKKLVIIDGVLNINEERGSRSSFLSRYPKTISLFVHLITMIEPIVENRLKSFVYVKDNIDRKLVGLYTQPFGVKGTSLKLSRWIGDYTSDPLVYSSTKESEYGKLQIPVRVIWGKEDTLTPLSLAHSLLSLLSNGKLYVLDGVGHIPMIEDYKQSDDALLKSLQE